MRHHRAGDLVAEHARSGKADLGFDDVEVGVTDAAGPDLDQYLAGSRRWRRSLLDRHRHAKLVEDDRLHRTPSQQTSSEQASRRAQSSSLDSSAAYSSALNSPAPSVPVA